jgi:hypothetical protein
MAAYQTPLMQETIEIERNYFFRLLKLLRTQFISVCMYVCMYVCIYFTQNDVIMSLISKPHSWALLQNQSWTASNQSQGIQIVISSPRPGLEEPSG